MDGERTLDLARCARSGGEPARAASRKGLNSGLRPAQDERMYVMRTFVSVHHLEIDQVPNHPEFVGYAVRAQHVARGARDMLGANGISDAFGVIRHLIN